MRPHSILRLSLRGPQYVAGQSSSNATRPLPLPIPNERPAVTRASPPYKSNPLDPPRPPSRALSPRKPVPPLQPSSGPSTTAPISTASAPSSLQHPRGKTLWQSYNCKRSYLLFLSTRQEIRCTPGHPFLVLSLILVDVDYTFSIEWKSETHFRGGQFHGIRWGF
jgi:hypothetical protein